MNFVIYTYQSFIFHKSFQRILHSRWSFEQNGTISIEQNWIEIEASKTFACQKNGKSKQRLKNAERKPFMRQISNEEDSTHCIQHLTKWISFRPLLRFRIFCRLIFCWMKKVHCIFELSHQVSCYLFFSSFFVVFSVRLVATIYHILYLQRNKIHCQANDIQMIWLGNCSSITWKQKQEETRSARKFKRKGKWHQLIVCTKCNHLEKWQAFRKLI